MYLFIAGNASTKAMSILPIGKAMIDHGDYDDHDLQRNVDRHCHPLGLLITWS